MKEIQKLHSKAMELADAATLARSKGNIDEAKELLNEALDYESQAAIAANRESEFEPTRSVLFRSAASLALECGKVREAEKLIASALAGEPPEMIANELRDLLEQAYFARHLDLRGIELQRDEIQLTLSGSLVGFGVTSSDVFRQKLEKFEQMVRRTAERLLKRPFRVGGPPSREILENYGVFLSVPRAQSYAVTLRVSKPFQMSFPGLEKGEEVIDDIFSSLEFFKKSDLSGLKELIKDTRYFENFVQIAKQFAPDGKKVNQVGLTIVRDSKHKTVSLESISEEFFLIGETIEENVISEPVRIEGWLRYADSTHELVKIKIIDDKGKAYPITVPESMIDDIVRPLWADKVIVIGEKFKKEIHLKDIKRYED